MTDRQLTAALAGSAAAAAHAPSIHQTRPWRWVLRTHSLDLYADRDRQLTDIDPDGRLILISCGGALHYARTALAAEGLDARVSLLPDDDIDHVATLTATQPEPSKQAAVTKATTPPPAEPTARGERTARGEATASPAPSGHSQPSEPTEPTEPTEPIESRGRTGSVERHETTRTGLASAARALAAAAEAEGVHMWLMDRDQVVALAGASAVTRKMRERIGLDSSTVYAMLYGDDDTPTAWLRAGEALSAVSLEAARLGVSVHPSWTVAELPGTRKVVRRHTGTGVPYLALRIALGRTA